MAPNHKSLWAKVLIHAKQPNRRVAHALRRMLAQASRSGTPIATTTGGTPNMLMLVLRGVVCRALLCGTYTWNALNL